MAPQFVKPYVKTNKHDAADAEAICEAVTRPSMRAGRITREAGAPGCSASETGMWRRVAVANKNARIVWALLARDRPFRPDYAPAAVGVQSNH